MLWTNTFHENPQGFETISTSKSRKHEKLFHENPQGFETQAR